MFFSATYRILIGKVQLSSTCKAVKYNYVKILKSDWLSIALNSTVSVMPNRPFPSSKKFHFQNKAKCETFVVEMSFICIIIKTHFHNKGFALSLVLKVKLFGTRKWPINLTLRASMRSLMVFRYSFSCLILSLSDRYKIFTSD